MTLFEPLQLEKLNLVATETSAHIKYDGRATVAVQSKHAWKMGNTDVYYCECIFKDFVKQAVIRPAVGLAKKNFPTRNCWLSDIKDCCVWVSEGIRYSTMGTEERFVFRDWPEFDPGDTIGIGMNSKNGEVFCTLNGDLIKVLTIITNPEPMFFTLNMNCRMECTVEFDPMGFQFDLSSLPDNIIPLVGNLETTPKWTQKQLILYMNKLHFEEQEKLKDIYNQIAKNARYKYSYQVLIATSLKNSELILQHIDVVKFPTLVAVKFSDTNLISKHVLQENLTVEGINKFIEDIKNGAKPYIKKSSPRPLNDRHPSHKHLVHVVADSFHELVMMNQKCVLFLRYSPNYSWARQVKLIFIIISEVFADDPNLDVCFYDNSIDEVPAYENYGQDYSIKLFYKGKVNDSYNYAFLNDITITSILQFVRDNNPIINMDIDERISKARELMEKIRPANHITIESESQLVNCISSNQLVVVHAAKDWDIVNTPLATFCFELSQTYPNINFVNMNTTKYQELAEKYGVSLFKLFKNGIGVGSLDWAWGNAATQLINLIESKK